MPELAALFESLAAPIATSSTVGSFSGTQIADSQHHLAKDGRGRPVVLLTALETDTRPASLQLENLQVDHGLQCRIGQASGDIIESRFSVAQCRTDDAVLQRCFLDLFDAILSAIPAEPSQRDIAETLQRMASLFLAIERPPRRAAQGLWGELLLIARSSDPAVIADAWHNEASERYDFASGLQRLEVKTSADRTRNHHFSFEQAHPAPSVQCVIVSMFVEQATGGRSLGDMWDEVRDLVSGAPELRVRIDEVCLAALGNTWQQARAVSFDEQLAVASLGYFDVRDIPRLPSDVPTGVTQIRFRSDVSLGTSVHDAERETVPLLELLPGNAV